MPPHTPSADAILDAALKLADQQSWESLRLHQVADTLGCSLEQIRTHYRQKEDLIDAWFDRADRAMLLAVATREFNTLPPLQRIEQVMMEWLLALAPHQRTTRQMLLGRLEPGHLHIQIAGIMRISRTVQWMREAAGRNAAHLNRAVEESLLTSLYLATLSRWLLDDSRDFANTRRQLQRRLKRLEPLLKLTEGQRERPLALLPSAKPQPGQQTPVQH
ncbi:TetR/AcrR family transcriptional regulator [Motiliproteus sediminis]|uniref:TetR/AcrR family transcriptional regulator n=1 Tax=Motiliproteus sediminis TaxID=1468178 RepID=UPI001AEF3723|nr:TetR/AcrR family transcriptional regulator [Motiliproteus sediminis]